MFGLLKVATAGLRAAPKIASGARSLTSGAGPAVKAGAGLLAGAVALDAVAIPAWEGITGQDVQIGGLDAGTLTRDALANIAGQTGETLGQTQAEFYRGFGEGGLQGLLGLDDSTAAQFVTIAILGIGTVLLIKLVTD